MDEYPLFINLQYALTAFSDYNGNALDRAVFTDIAQFANRYGISYTTTRRIAERLGRRREEVSKSVNRIKDKGFWTITQEKKGLDRHPRNVYHIAKQFIRRHPDKRSKHFNASKWQRWCEIGRKRAITIKLKQKKTGTIRDTAAEMATRPIAASASPTPAQAREARARRGGGFAELGDALRGMGLLGASTTVAPAVKDTYKTENQQRGDLLQQLREHEAAAAAMASQPIQAAPMITTAPVPPLQQPPTQPTASEQRERKAQAYEELQALRERLRQQGTASSQASADGTARAVQDVARDYARASRPAAMASPWASWAATPADPTPRGDMAQARRELQQLRARRAAYSADPWADPAPLQPIQQPQATPDMEQEATSAWLAGLKDVQRQAVRDVRKMASQRAGYAAEPSSRRGIVRL